MARLRPALAFLGAALLCLTACAPGGSLVEQLQAGQSGQGRQSAARELNLRTLSATEQAQTFAQYYEQQIEWKPCQETGALEADLAQSLAEAGRNTHTIECADIDVPLDWRLPDQHDSISVSISRMSAAGDSKGVIFSNPGGPGEEGLKLWFDKPLTSSGQALKDFDLAGFDPRGIGHSTPVVCESNAEDVADQLAECAKENPLVAAMGTLQVARDMELMRHLLGAQQMNYLGYSYGTILGATYATIFPEKTGKMVLDSAENAAWASPVHLVEQTLSIAEQIMELAHKCHQEYLPAGGVQACPFQSGKDLQTLMASADAAPWKGSGDNQISGDLLYEILTNVLYYPPQDRMAAMDLMAAARDGDAEAVDTLIEFNEAQQPQLPEEDLPQSERGESGEALHNLAQQIVTCHSTPGIAGIEAAAAYLQSVTIPEFLGTAADLTPIAGEGLCDKSPFTGDDITDHFLAPKVEYPIVVIGVTGDHATPYRYSEELVQELGNARLLTVEGSGHAMSLSGRSLCLDEAVLAYFRDGTLPDVGVRCVVNE